MTIFRQKWSFLDKKVPLTFFARHFLAKKSYFRSKICNTCSIIFFDLQFFSSIPEVRIVKFGLEQTTIAKVRAIAQENVFVAPGRQRFFFLKKIHVFLRAWSRGMPVSPRKKKSKFPKHGQKFAKNTKIPHESIGTTLLALTGLESQKPKCRPR